MSPSKTFQLGRFFLRVSQAHLSISFKATHFKPAFSIPIAKPPAPANSSKTV